MPTPARKSCHWCLPEEHPYETPTDGRTCCLQVACNDSVREYCKYGGDAETDRLCKVAGCVQGESRG